MSIFNNTKASKRDNAYNINLLTDIVNAMQMEINIIKEKITLIEKHNKLIVEKVSDTVELCQTIAKSKNESNDTIEPKSKHSAIIKNSSVYL